MDDAREERGQDLKFGTSLRFNLEIRIRMFRRVARVVLRLPPSKQLLGRASRVAIPRFELVRTEGSTVQEFLRDDELFVNQNHTTNFPLLGLEAKKLSGRFAKKATRDGVWRSMEEYGVWSS
jgi:hypothetical protein